MKAHFEILRTREISMETVQRDLLNSPPPAVQIAIDVCNWLFLKLNVQSSQTSETMPGFCIFGSWEMGDGLWLVESQPTLNLLGWAVAVCWNTAAKNANIPKNCFKVMKASRLPVWEQFLTRCPSTGQLKHLHSQRITELWICHPGIQPSFRQTCPKLSLFK